MVVLEGVFLELTEPHTIDFPRYTLYHTLVTSVEVMVRFGSGKGDVEKDGRESACRAFCLQLSAEAARSAWPTGRVRHPLV